MSTLSLRATGVSKSFGGVHACRSVDLEISAGRVTALIGPNGAGKTSLLNCLSGHSIPDKGVVELAGEALTGRKAHEFASRGLARTFQNLETFDSLTMIESVKIGAHLAGSAGHFSSAFRRKRHKTDEAELTEMSEKALDRVGLSQMAHRPAGSVDPGSLRLAEIARAIARHPDVLLLDEPVAGLSAKESRDVATVIRTLADEGTAVLISDHDLPTIMSVAHDVYVLNNGEIISHGEPEEIRSDPQVIAAYLGDEWDPRKGAST